MPERNEEVARAEQEKNRHALETALVRGNDDEARTQFLLRFSRFSTSLRDLSSS